MRTPLAIALLLVLPLAGCATSPAAGRDAALGPLHFPTMAVQATPDDPFEQPGDIRVAWQDGLFAIASEGEGDLARRSVVDADAGSAYTTNQGLAWTRHSWPASLGTVSARLLLWDLRTLAEDPALDLEATANPEGRNLTFAGTVERAGRAYPVHLELGVRGDEVTWALLDAPMARESPFTFRPDARPFPFPVQVPAASRTPAEVSEGERASHPGHVQILGWIQDYLRTRGTLPPEPTPDELRLQVLASGRPWPTNPFDGTPVEDRHASGHFEWVRCGDRDGDYRGLGHDGILLQQVFGVGCKNL